jgi:hypothetical protein
MLKGIELEYLSDQLHVTIFDTVVDHLNVMAGTFITNPVTARFIVTLGSNALEHILDVRPCLLVSTRHQTGAVTSTLLTTRDTGSDESDALLSKVFAATVGVREMGITTINDDVTSFDVGEDRLDEVIDWLSSHDEQHDSTGFLELGAELLDGVSTHDGLACIVTSSAMIGGIAGRATEIYP